MSKLNGMDLKIERIKRGLKMKEVATALEFTEGYISLMENEKKPIPDYVYHRWVRLLHNEK